MINTANDTTGASDEVWSGAWVRERLGVELVGDEELTGLLPAIRAARLSPTESLRTV